MRTHTCRKCGETKPEREFYVVRGYRCSPCKACTRKTTARYREAHREELRAKHRADYWAVGKIRRATCGA